MSGYASLKKRWKWIVSLILGTIGIAAHGASAAEKGITGTEEYRAAHGLVAGQTNSLRIKGILFRFPPQYMPEPYSADKIVKGKSDRATIHLDLSKWISPRPIANSENIASVRIEIRQDGYEDAKGIREAVRNEKWKSIKDRPELELRERIRIQDDGGWGYRTYESMNSKYKTPLGGPIVFKCAGNPGQEPELCRTSFQHPRGPLVSYYLSGYLLPRWRNVHTEVLKLIDSFIVE